MIVGPLSQRVILYDAGRGKNLVYTTAYTDKQIEGASHFCAKRHGRRSSNIRSVLAAEAR